MTLNRAHSALQQCLQVPGEAAAPGRGDSGGSGCADAPRMERLRNAGVAMIVLAGLAVPVALAAPPVRVAPGQTVDLKVLLISADGSEPGFGAWKAELDREGVPYDTLAGLHGQTKTATLTDARARRLRRPATRATRP